MFKMKLSCLLLFFSCSCCLFLLVFCSCNLRSASYFFSYLLLLFLARATFLLPLASSSFLLLQLAFFFHVLLPVNDPLTPLYSCNWPSSSMSCFLFLSALAIRCFFFHLLLSFLLSPLVFFVILLFVSSSFLMTLFCFCFCFCACCL